MSKFRGALQWISLSTNIISDLGADHIDFIELLLEIEAQFDMTFGDDFDENTSYEVNNIFGYVLGKIEAPRGKNDR